MKVVKATLFAFIIVVTISACSCWNSTNGDQAISIDIRNDEKIEREISPVLEIPWGNGDGEIGYTNEQFEGYVEINTGPCGFCIGREGSIYIDDCMNYRFSKYSSDGNFVASVPKNKFTERTNAPKPLEMISVADDLVLFKYGGSIIQRYNFDSGELLTIDLNEEGFDKPYIVEVLSDDNGVVYAFSMSIATSERILYRVGPSFSAVLERRELPDLPQGSVGAVDDSGNLYFSSLEQKGSLLRVQRISPKNKLQDVLSIRKTEDKSLMLLQTTEDNGFLFLSRSIDEANILRVDGNTSIIYELPMIPRLIEAERNGRIFFDFYLTGDQITSLHRYDLNMLDSN